MLKEASLTLPQLFASTVGVMHKLRVDMIAIVSEAKQHPGASTDTVCVSNADNEFAVLSSDKIEERVAGALDLLYNQTKLWERNLQDESAKVPMVQAVYNKLREIQKQLSATVQYGLDKRPGSFCIEISRFEDLIDMVFRVENFSAKLKTRFETKVARASSRAILFHGARYTAVQ